MSRDVRMLIVMIVGQWLMSPAENARILALETVSGISHWNFMSAVLRSLTDVGHEVTVFTPFPNGDRINYTEVDTSKDFRLVVSCDIIKLINKIGKSTNYMDIMVKRNREYCDNIYQNEKFVALITDRRKRAEFDLIIMESFAVDCTSYLASLLNIPIIFTIPSSMILLKEFPSLGYVPNPAYVSHMLADHAVPKTFVQRFINVAEILYAYYTITYQEMKFKIIDPKLYDWTPTVQPSLIFINTHFVTDAPKPVSPNLISVGGIHLKTPKSIPKVNKTYIYYDNKL